MESAEREPSIAAISVFTSWVLVPGTSISRNPETIGCDLECASCCSSWVRNWNVASAAGWQVSDHSDYDPASS